MYYSCPNETVTYTCHDSQVKIIYWVVEPYVTENHMYARTNQLSPKKNILVYAEFRKYVAV